MAARAFCELEQVASLRVEASAAFSTCVLAEIEEVRQLCGPAVASAKTSSARATWQ
jgi:hypothetical protein